MTASARRRWLVTPAIALFLALPTLADDQRGNVGYLDLIARLGSGNEPTGAGVRVGHVEAPQAGSYAPNTADNHLLGKTFNFRSGASGASSHANTVARHMYGTSWSAAPGVDVIDLYEANHWIQSGFLNFGGGPPLTAEASLFNCSWIGTTQNNALDNEILRRADFAVHTQHLIMCVGVSNGAGAFINADQLMSHAYNHVTVGRSDGEHHAGGTRSTLDGPGRMKPDIVVPENTTSWATGVVSGVVASLIETAREWPGLDNNSNARRSETIKAALLAGARHRAAWTNNPGSGANRGVTATPYDPVFGVDEANIDRSHMILTGLEQDGATTVPLSGSAAPAGWDLFTINAGQSRYYRFEFLGDKPEFSVLLTWHRRVSANFGSFSMPNLDLELFAVTSGGSLISLRGDPGIPVFGSGNIASISAVDNVEHLFIRDLAPGAYVLRVTRASDGLEPWDAALAWLTEPDSVDPAALTGFTMIRGTHTGGGLTDLTASDNQYLRTRSGFGNTFTDLHSMEIIVNAQTASANRRILQLTVESSISHAAGGTARIRLRNRNTTQFEQVGIHAVGQSDFVFRTLITNPANYVGSGGEVDVSIRHIVVVPIFAFQFNSFFDEVKVVVN
ncbi:MAG: hypothetical protein HRU76_06785 [Phycisphaeraceae bacterium]|nr:MAG: hypothetical protein HRU76_06785 [Phycisphaeraceae bacterium]